jgi:hypothetical protein
VQDMKCGFRLFILRLFVFHLGEYSGSYFELGAETRVDLHVKCLSLTEIGTWGQICIKTPKYQISREQTIQQISSCFIITELLQQARRTDAKAS